MNIEKKLENLKVLVLTDTEQKLVDKFAEACENYYAATSSPHCDRYEFSLSKATKDSLYKAIVDCADTSDEKNLIQAVLEMVEKTSEMCAKITQLAKDKSEVEEIQECRDTIKEVVEKENTESDGKDAPTPEKENPRHHKTLAEYFKGQEDKYYHMKEIPVVPTGNEYDHDDEYDEEKPWFRSIDLKDTVDDMLSADYKRRFKAEYNQLAIRVVKLQSMLNKYRDNKLNFEPSCTYECLYEQLIYMKNYMDCLETRAIIEDIDL